MVPNELIAKWGRLKRLTYIIDDQVKTKRISGPFLTEPDEHGVHFMSSGETTREVDELHQLVYDLELVSPEYNWMDHPIPEDKKAELLDLDETKMAITGIFRGDRFIDGLLASNINSKRVQELCRRAYFLELTRDNWPTHFPLNSDGSIQVGLVCRSIDGKIEGRTEGDRRKCPSQQCLGWLVGVRWEDGQLLRICTAGWHFDPVKRELTVVGGGPISARVVSPKPLGRKPLPRELWPTKAELRKFRSWSNDFSK